MKDDIHIENKHMEWSDIISYQGNTNGNYSEIPLSTQQDGYNKKIQIIFLRKQKIMGQYH